MAMGPLRASVTVGCAVAFAAAAAYLDRLDRHEVQRRLDTLTGMAVDALAGIKGVHLLQPSGSKPSAILSFTMEGAHPHDLAQVAR